MIFIMPKETAITLNTEFIMVKMFLAQENLPCKKYSITFMDGPVQLGKIAQFIPEFKPANECKKSSRNV